MKKCSTVCMGKNGFLQTCFWGEKETITMKNTVPVCPFLILLMSDGVATTFGCCLLSYKMKFFIFFIYVNNQRFSIVGNFESQIECFAFSIDGKF